MAPIRYPYGSRWQSGQPDSAARAKKALAPGRLVDLLSHLSPAPSAPQAAMTIGRLVGNEDLIHGIPRPDVAPERVRAILVALQRIVLQPTVGQA